MNPEAQGTEYPPVPFRIDPERVAAFREVVGQAEGIPPTFLTVAEFLVFPQVIEDPNVDLDFSRVVHGTQEYVFSRPLREGELLNVHMRIESVRVRSGTGFLIVGMRFLDEGGEPVASARSTMIERAAG
jgi:hypothetical protein